MPSAVNAAFFTISVAVFQPRISARRACGSPIPLRSRATAAVAKSFSVSRGGRLTQRVIASTPPGASRAIYACSASTV